MTPNVGYKGKVSNNSDAEIKKLCRHDGTRFKIRLCNHVMNTTNAKYKNTTELSKYFWSLKDDGKVANATFEILYVIQGKSRYNFCRLCTIEKLIIIENSDDDSV